MLLQVTDAVHNSYPGVFIACLSSEQHSEDGVSGEGNNLNCECNDLLSLLRDWLWGHSKYPLRRDIPNTSAWHLHHNMCSYLLARKYNDHLFAPHLAQLDRTSWCLYNLCSRMHGFMDVRVLESSRDERHALRGHF